MKPFSPVYLIKYDYMFVSITKVTFLSIVNAFYTYLQSYFIVITANYYIYKFYGNTFY